MSRTDLHHRLSTSRAPSAPHPPQPQPPDPALDDESFQDEILPGVSRTFALTIPQLPRNLRGAVANAYLLCRLADTIEDDPALTADEKDAYHRGLLGALAGTSRPEGFAASLAARLSPATPAAERRLAAESPRVLRLTLRLSLRQRRAVRRCVEVMSTGMAHYERRRGLQGLPTLYDMERYCYFVAGVVGEMLTELFCEHSAEIAANRTELMGLAAHFGQALQMTNILKDVWEDLDRGTCWLPRDVFLAHGLDLTDLPDSAADPAFAEGMRHMVGVAHASLREALRYTLLIPRHETGIRRFLSWAIGLALLTLQNIVHRPGFTSGDEVKVPRPAVAGLVNTTNAVIRSNTALSALFNVTAHGLPLDGEPAGWRTGDAPVPPRDHDRSQRRGIL